MVWEADLEILTPRSALSLLPMQLSGVPAGQRQLVQHHAPWGPDSQSRSYLQPHPVQLLLVNALASEAIMPISRKMDEDATIELLTALKTSMCGTPNLRLDDASRGPASPAL